jgi:adenine-specific DNA-methyltransferase
MYSRLKISRNLLQKDGLIVISIDEIEHANLKKLCDEVFGGHNFCGEIVWKNSSKNDQDYISVQHEYFVVYAKDKQANKGEWVERKQGLEEIYKAFDGFKRQHGTNWEAIHAAALEWYRTFPESNPVVDSRHYNWMDKRGVYFASDISGPNFGQYVYEVAHPITKQPVKPPASGWRYPEPEIKQRIADERVHFGPDHTTIPKNKTYLKDTEFQSLTSMRFVDGRAASNRLEELFGAKVFTNPKDELLLADLFKAVGVSGNDLVLDFFSGSATTAHAVFELNKNTGSNCRVVLVQIAESLEEMLKLATGSSKKVVQDAMAFLKNANLPQTIAELSKERIRRAGKLVHQSNAKVDIGFRAFKIDASSMADVYYLPDALDKAKFDLFVDNIKPDRTPEDLLFQVMLDWGVDLALSITKHSIQGRDVFFVDGNALAACFDASGSIDEAFVKELATQQPLRVVFRDAGYKNSAVKINVEQIFKLLSPATEVKCI